MRLLELFSGAGGLAKGLELAGFNHLAFVESNCDACHTLRANFDPSKVFEGDVKDYDFSTLGPVEMVAGGPPCQPFSLGGKHRASEDARDMFPYALKAINVLRPKAFIFENVKGLLRSNFADYFEYIILRLKYPDYIGQRCDTWFEHLAKLRDMDNCPTSPPEYHVQYQLINAADHGVPQIRERVIVVGIRTDLDTGWTFPLTEHNLERLLWNQYISGDYWERHGIKKPLEYAHTPHFMRKIERIERQYGLFPPPPANHGLRCAMC